MGLMRAMRYSGGWIPTPFDYTYIILFIFLGITIISLIISLVIGILFLISIPSLSDKILLSIIIPVVYMLFLVYNYNKIKTCFYAIIYWILSEKNILKNTFKLMYLIYIIYPLFILSIGGILVLIGDAVLFNPLIKVIIFPFKIGIYSLILIIVFSITLNKINTKTLLKKIKSNLDFI